MNLCIALVFALTVVVTASSGDAVPPKGYRFPTASDSSGDWKESRGSVPTPYHVAADFNGDSRLDDAWILLADNASPWALVVFLGSVSGKEATTLTLLTDSGENPAQSMGMVRER